MSLFRLSLSFALAFMAMALRAQSTLPTLLKPLPAQTLVTTGTTITIDLRDYFGLPGVTGQVVQYDTVMGKFNVELLASAAPQHVANFLNYVQAGAYTSSFFHRSVAFESNGAISILQGGGYTWTGSRFAEVVSSNPVPLEYNLPNTRGTLAAARTDNINSATSGWYFNTRDNSTILGTGNGGGYTVFGRVLGSGMTVVDSLASTFPSRSNVLVQSVSGPSYFFSSFPARNYTSPNLVTTPNLSLINSISLVTVFPGAGGGSLLSLTGQISAPAVVDATISGSNLSLTPKALGTADVVIRATDSNGNVASSTFTITVSGPTSVSAAQGATVVFEAPAGATAYRWQRNGSDLSGGTSATVSLADMQPSKAGLFSAFMTSGTGTTSSRTAILGLTSTAKLVGLGTEFPNIVHPLTGFTYDQILLGGSAASVTADAGQILRMSYIDMNDDIVQVEFSGPGTLTLVLDTPTGPALPQKYNQNVQYLRGHAGIILTGANATTNLTVFSVGRAVAGSNPALYRDDVTYDGMAGIAFIAITSTDGQFGGLRAANANFYATRGLTGVYAPDVRFSGPVFVGEITAVDDATPVLRLGSGGDVRITGGDLAQSNNRAVQVSGIAQLKFTAGSSSHGTNFPVQTNQGRLEQDGVEITSQIVVY